MDDFLMDGLWMGGMVTANHSRRSMPSSSVGADNRSLQTQEEIRELQHQIGRLSLLNQALWELLRERAGLTDAELERKAKEIDLRDGVEDGKMGGGAVSCPTCRRVSNAKHFKCLYCGELFEKPAFG